MYSTNFWTIGLRVKQTYERKSAEHESVQGDPHRVPERICTCKQPNKWRQVTQIHPKHICNSARISPQIRS